MVSLTEKLPRAPHPALNRSREKQLLPCGIIHGEGQRAVEGEVSQARGQHKEVGSGGVEAEAGAMVMGCRGSSEDSGRHQKEMTSMASGSSFVQ